MRKQKIKWNNKWTDEKKWKNALKKKRMDKSIEEWKGECKLKKN